jgi:hypothetical protein
MSKPPEPEEFAVVTDSYMRDAGLTRGRHRTLSICRALGQIYNDTKDPETRLKLRYASTLARYYILKLREFDREYADNLCPKFGDYNRMMRRKERVWEKP